MKTVSRQKRVLTIRVCRSSYEEETADREFWQALSPEDRLIETWRLSEELWRMRNDFNDEPGLCRSFARVFHPKKD